MSRTTDTNETTEDTLGRIADTALGMRKIAPPTRTTNLLSALAGLSRNEGSLKTSALLAHNLESATSRMTQKVSASVQGGGQSDNAEDGREAGKGPKLQKRLRGILRGGRKRISKIANTPMTGVMSADIRQHLKRRYINRMMRLLRNAAVLCEGAGRRTITAGDLSMVATGLGFRTSTIDPIKMALEDIQGFGAKTHAQKPKGEAEAAA